MKVSFIGSGNVATHLALAMYNRGHVIEQVMSRNIQHAELLADRVEAQAVDNAGLLRGTSNVYIIAVSDNALLDVAGELRLGNALVLHTSGATPASVLKHTSTRYGVIWSPQSFVRDVALEYNELPFCIEGCDRQTEDDIEEFVSMISEHISRTTFKQRQYLHLSAVFVNNFTNGLYAAAQQICRTHDVPFDLLHPLITTTAKRVQWGDVRFQLTGPAARGDQQTIDAHRRLIAKEPDMLAIYDCLTDYLKQVKK